MNIDIFQKLFTAGFAESVYTVKVSQEKGKCEAAF